MCGEAAAGIRRHAGTEYGQRYQSALGHFGTGDHSAPDPHGRTLGDHVSPFRAGNWNAVLNGAAVRVGSDVAEWTVDRLLLMAGSIARESRQRAESE